MNILAIGDVTSPAGVKHLCERLWGVRREYGIDLCIVNAENASLVSGPQPHDADALLAAGADVLTGGNHTLRARGLHAYLEEHTDVLRPLNFPADVPGSGYTVKDVLGYRVLVINAMGNVLIDPVLDNPYGPLDRLLAREAGRYDLAVLDLHAEATGEKLALAYAYDGRIHAVFGTHTHVPTADLQILPQGTGYVTDVGMCGETGGVLGMDAEVVVRRMRTRLPEKFVAARGPVAADGVVFTVDPVTKRTTSVRRIRF